MPLGYDVQDATRWTDWPQQQQQQTNAEYLPAYLDEHIANVNPDFDWEAGPSTTDYSQQQAGPSTHAHICHYEDCSYSCESQRKLTKHILRKHEKPHGCKASDHCDHRTAEPRDMNRHYWSTHKEYARRHNIPGDEEYPCSKCGEIFTRADNLKRHKDNKKCRRAP